MGWTRKIISFLLFPFLRRAGRQGLLALPEKRELEALLRAQLLQYYDQHGAASLLQPGVFVVIDSGGARVQRGRPPAESCLVAVETRSLPSALSLLAIGQQNIVVPRDAVKFLGTEAASAAAAAINKLQNGPATGG